MRPVHDLRFVEAAGGQRIDVAAEMDDGRPGRSSEIARVVEAWRAGIACSSTNRPFAGSLSGCRSGASASSRFFAVRDRDGRSTVERSRDGVNEEGGRSSVGRRDPGDRDHAAGLLRIRREARKHLDVLDPQPVAFGAFAEDLGMAVMRLVAELELDVRVRLQVYQPARRRRGPPAVPATT